MPLEKTTNIELSGIYKKQRILDAALEVFAQKSYHEASMNNIANLVGVSKGLIYYYLHLTNRLVKKYYYEKKDHCIGFKWGRKSWRSSSRSVACL